MRGGIGFFAGAAGLPDPIAGAVTTTGGIATEGFFEDAPPPSSMSFWRFACADRLVVYIGVVNCAVSIDRNRRISAGPLWKSARHSEDVPGYTRIRAEYAAL